MIMIWTPGDGEDLRVFVSAAQCVCPQYKACVWGASSKHYQSEMEISLYVWDKFTSNPVWDSFGEPKGTCQQ